MPYKSGKQARFFEMCRHSPEHAKGQCPDQETLTEFHNAEYHGGEGVRGKLIAAKKKKK